MSTLRVNTLQDVSGTGQPTMPGAATGAFSESGMQVYTKNTNTALADFTNVCIAVFR